MKRINYKQISNLNPDWIKSQIDRFIKEDAPNGHVTSDAIISKKSDMHVKMVAAESFVFCGEQIIPYCFPSNCIIEPLFVEGSQISRGDCLAIINGPANEILTYERVLLNLIQRLCGISTETRRYTNLNLPKKFKVIDTRKITPGLRKFEKYAVHIGGGWNHRLDLLSGKLIKDNHIQAAGSIQEAIDQIKLKNKRGLPIELEVDNLDQLAEGLKFDLDGYLLDNMEPRLVRKAVNMIRKQSKDNTIFIEASGNINYKNLEEYAKTGVDGVSMSAITAQAPAVDIKLEFN